MVIDRYFLEGLPHFNGAYTGGWAERAFLCDILIGAGTGGRKHSYVIFLLFLQLKETKSESGDTG